MIRPVNSVSARLPNFSSNVPTYNDDGNTSTGWTTTNVGMSIPAAGNVRATQTLAGAGTGIASRAVTMPVVNKDWVLYGRIRGRESANDAHRVTIVGAGSARASLYLNFNTVTNASVLGAVSIRHTSAAAVNSNQLIASGVAYQTDWVDFALQYDSKFLNLAAYFRQTDGTWLPVGSVVGSYFGATLDLATNNAAVNGAYIEFDFLTLTAANLIAIGDSLTEGATLFSPNRTSALTNGLSTWMAHCPVYLNERNNLIINKGVGGNTSALVAGRIQADVMDNLPKVVFLGACNNDSATITLADRTTNIQNSLNIVTGGGAEPVLFNAVYRTAASAGQPAYRDYYRTWWQQYRGTTSGAYSYINPMVVLGDANDYMEAAYTQADGVHCNVTGYTRYGQYMAGLKVT